MPCPDQTLLQQLLDYDPMTGELTWKYRPAEMFSNPVYQGRWNNRYAGKPAFTALSRKGYHVGAIGDQPYRANRIIWKLVYGIEADQVDHVNGDPADDRLANLRQVTGQQNQQNMKRSKANKSGVTGVSWNTAKKKWDAKIMVNRKGIFLGRYDNLSDAIAARKDAERVYNFHPNHGR